MTAIADITVKKYDDTTNITWSAIGGAGSDGSQALWRSNSATGYVGQKPKFTLSASWNSPGTVRKLVGNISFPSVYTDTSTSLTAPLATMSLSFTIFVPQNVQATDLQEFSAQAVRLLSDTMVRGSILSGFAPT